VSEFTPTVSKLPVVFEFTAIVCEFTPLCVNSPLLCLNSPQVKLMDKQLAELSNVNKPPKGVDKKV
jgi:hypothetical protein